MKTFSRARNYSLTFPLAAALFWSAGAVLAQTPGGTNAARPRANPPPIVSPEVRADRTVTFRLRAPKASEVTVSGEFGTRKMTNDGAGLWSITVGPLDPELYGYGFSVDGLRLLDPANASIKPMRSPNTSILEVPGDPPLPFDFRPEIPHGTVRLHWYQSKSLGKRRNLCVYTPPGYDQKPEARYPVLYLLHGSGDNEATWSALGRAQLISDNLLAQGKIQPMIMVMPDGHASFAQPAAGAGDEAARNRNAFQRDLLEDVLPFVAANYRTRPDRESQAIIGLSMGGGQSLTIGLNRLDLFAWVGGMSSAVRDPEQTVAAALANAKATNEKLKLLWFGCGRDDFLLKQNQQFDELLTARGIKHEYMLSAGGHSWPVWRRYLVEFLPKVFAKP
jgi:enterochelin esterase-like enzyme